MTMQQPQFTTTQYNGKEGEDPSSPPWGHGNYVGPYWSNGKIQESVLWGDKDPVDELDALARQHDAAYAQFKDRAHREAADAIFAEEARKLIRKPGNSSLASDPKVAAMLAEYGNYAARQAGKLASAAAYSVIPGVGPLFAALKFGVDNIREMNSRIKGTHLKKELETVRAFYGTDPRRSKGSGSSTEDGNLKVAPPGRKPPPYPPRIGPESTHVAGVQGSPAARTPPLGKAVSGSPSPNPGPHSNLLWPSKQAKRFQKFQARYNAVLAEESGLTVPVYKKKSKGGTYASVLPGSYKRKKKKNKRNTVRPL